MSARGAPDDIAAMNAFPASDEASDATGGGTIFSAG